MPLDAPRFWYAPPADTVRGWAGWARWVLPRLLAPAGGLYGAAAVWRYRSVRPYRSALPVICIGNFTVGGTGKTPLAIHVAALLRELGHRPAFLTRGYGGRTAGPHLVDPARDGAADVGDEPLLLARHAPTFVARDRAAGAARIEQTDASVIVMDDGLQNPQLHKDLALAVIDGARGLGNARVLPAGPLRAPLAFQTGLADGLIISTDAGAEPQTWQHGLPADLQRKFAGATLVVGRRPSDPAALQGRRFIAFAGIGRPEGFFAMAERAGAILVARVALPDHHVYTPADARRLLAMATAADASLLTTQKDGARLGGAVSGGSDDALAQLAAGAVQLVMALALAPDAEAQLTAWLTVAMERRERPGA